MSRELSKCPDCGAPIPDGAPRGLCPKCLLKGVATPTNAGTAATPDGQPPTPPAPEKLSAAFPQLEIIELIGQGGMGYVYKARQPKLDRLVALKVLPETFGHDSAFTERFTREGRLLARLNHPNIISIFDFGVVESPDPSDPHDLFYLIMEFVDGVNLRQAMAAGKFTTEQALNVVPKICDALQYAHDEGVLHRDIKPENILLDTRGRVKIADFGVAKLIQDTQSEPNLTASGCALGTRNYMAPEQIEQPSRVDHRADIYSLGVVFYELLTGELPIGRFSPPSSKTPVNAEVDDIVLQSLEKEPDRRQQSASEVKTQVETAAQKASTHRTTIEEIPASGSSSPSRAKQKKKLSPLAWVAMTLALVILIPILFLGGIAILGALIGVKFGAGSGPAQQTLTHTRLELNEISSHRNLVIVGIKGQAIRGSSSLAFRIEGARLDVEAEAATPVMDELPIFFPSPRRKEPAESYTWTIEGDRRIHEYRFAFALPNASSAELAVEKARARILEYISLPAQFFGELALFELPTEGGTLEGRIKFQNAHQVDVTADITSLSSLDTPQPPRPRVSSSREVELR